MNVFDLIYEDDVFSLSSLIAILTIVGANMANERERKRGWRVAALAFVYFLVHATLALKPSTAGELTEIAIRALFAGGLALGSCWIALAVSTFFVRELPNPVRHVTTVPPVSDAQPPRNPGSEIKETEVEEPSGTATKPDTTAACEDFRLECELLYSQRMEANGMPLERFNQLLDLYLPATGEVSLIENRVAMIKSFINDHVSNEDSAVSDNFESLLGIAEHFESLRKEARELPYDDESSDSIMTAINNQEDQAITSFFSKTP